MTNLICLHATTAHGVTIESAPSEVLMTFDYWRAALDDVQDDECISCWATPAQVALIEEDYGVQK
jgi:hypothetical protein